MSPRPVPVPPLPTVLLRHELPDGSHHFDWMLAQDAGGTLPLITFRLQARIDEAAGVGGRAGANRLADHRPQYLNYEGTISGGRGRVTRVAAGTITAWRQHEEGGMARWTLHVRWADPRNSRYSGPQSLELRQVKDEVWDVVFARVDGRDR